MPNQKFQTYRNSTRYKSTTEESCKNTYFILSLLIQQWLELLIFFDDLKDIFNSCGNT